MDVRRNDNERIGLKWKEKRGAERKRTKRRCIRKIEEVGEEIYGKGGRKIDGLTAGSGCAEHQRQRTAMAGAMIREGTTKRGKLLTAQRAIEVDEIGAYKSMRGVYRLQEAKRRTHRRCTQRERLAQIHEEQKMTRRWTKRGGGAGSEEGRKMLTGSQYCPIEQPRAIAQALRLPDWDTGGHGALRRVHSSVPPMTMIHKNVVLEESFRRLGETSTKTSLQHAGCGRASKKSNKSASAPEPEANAMLPGDDLASDTFNLAAQRVALHRPRVSPVLEEDDDVQEDDGGFKTATYIMIDDALDYPGYIKEEPMDEDPVAPFSYHNISPHRPQPHSTTFHRQHIPLPAPPAATTRPTRAHRHQRCVHHLRGPQPNPIAHPLAVEPTRRSTPRHPFTYANSPPPRVRAVAPWWAGLPNPAHTQRMLCCNRLASGPPFPYILATSSPPQPLLEESEPNDTDDDYMRTEQKRETCATGERRPQMTEGNRVKSKGRKKSLRGAIEMVDSDAEEDFTGGRQGEGKDKDKGKAKAKDKGKVKDTGKAKDAEKGMAKEGREGQGEGEGGQPEAEVPDAVASTDEEPWDDDDKQHEDNDAAQGSFKPGPVPADIIQRAVAAHDTFLATIKLLARNAAIPHTLHQLAAASSRPRGVVAMERLALCTLRSIRSLHANKSSTGCLARRSGALWARSDEISDAARVWVMPWLRTWHEELMATATLQWRDRQISRQGSASHGPIVQQRLMWSSARGIHDTSESTCCYLSILKAGSQLHVEVQMPSRRCGRSTKCRSSKAYWTLSMCLDGGGMNLLPAEFLQKPREPARLRAATVRQDYGKQTFTACAAAGSTVATKADTFKMQWDPRFLDFAFEQFKLMKAGLSADVPVKKSRSPIQDLHAGMEKAEKAKGWRRRRLRHDEAMAIMAWDK
ncbi:hypothetical protein FB451DRAFT_1195881, partial [Mycena latifolia]